jgi:hypothetical protein
MPPPVGTASPCTSQDNAYRQRHSPLPFVKSKETSLVSKTRTDPLAAAVTQHEQDKQDHAVAVAHAADVRSRARTDHDIATADLTNADAGVELAALRVEGSAAALAKVRRSVVNTDTSLAAALLASDVFAAVLPEVPVSLATARPTAAPGAVPCAVQSQPSVRDLIEGRISGQLEVYYFRSPLNWPVPTDHLERVADERQIMLTAHPRGASEVDGTVVERIGLDVLSAFAPVPLVTYADLDGTSAWRVPSFASGLQQNAVRAMQRATASAVGVSLGHGDATASARSVRVVADAPVVLSAGYDARGVRQIALSVGLAAYPDDASFTGEELAAGLTRVVEAMQGRCVSALGRVTSATIGNVLPVDGSRVARAVVAEFVLTSRLPDGERAPGAARATEPTVPAQRPARDVREHLDAGGSDVTKHPGVQRK